MGRGGRKKHSLWLLLLLLLLVSGAFIGVVTGVIPLAPLGPSDNDDGGGNGGSGGDGGGGAGGGDGGNGGNGGGELPQVGCVWGMSFMPLGVWVVGMPIPDEVSAFFSDSDTLGYYSVNGIGSGSPYSMRTQIVATYKSNVAAEGWTLLDEITGYNENGIFYWFGHFSNQGTGLIAGFILAPETIVVASDGRAGRVCGQSDYILGRWGDIAALMAAMGL